MKRLALILAGALALGLTVYTLAENRAPKIAGLSTGTFQTERLALPDVELIDAAAQPQRFKGALTQGHVVVINFNYTTCDTICPLGNVVMADLDAMLGPDRAVRLLSITIDPARDTPDRMRAAAEEFGASARWHWLTGNPGEVKRLLAAFDADYANIVLHDPMFLVGRVEDGRFYRSLSMPEAGDLKTIIDAMDS